MRVVLAFNAFKGTLTGDEVSRIVRDVVVSDWPDADVRIVPVADGGDGTLATALAYGFRPESVPAVDALSRPTSAVVGRQGDAALVELASVCGIAGIATDSWDGWETTSLGLGLACAALLDREVTDITVSLGGSASTDGGLGFLSGLGALPRDAQGNRCPPTLAGLEQVTTIDLTGLHPRAATARWRFLVDVDSPLTGPRGAARMFGPQKRLDPTAVARAEQAMVRWGALVAGIRGEEVADLPGSGAAGGILVGAHLACDPTVESGARFIARLTGLEAAIGDGDLVITGEGALDEQTLHGKGPGMVIALARMHSTPVAVIAGSSELSPADVGAVDLVTLTQVAGSTSAAIADPGTWLRAATRTLLGRSTLR